ncbi:DNA polymerase III subunit gamma/tau [Legionella spiritensis]|uniref:DNA polymerase III subunit gamma/tau n=1 Tax=Legionella spiritensis TaxID=452 RepID=UPI000F704181|nr:DNA polymerase III subunit gamma/tau [Legionella spiritensis]VEG92007.1 DNA polymerase III, gamma and tau subunits [Legionella spiritensis]
MSYLALARKWRPRTFSQLVGQEHVSQALINSLNQQRLHHAYLFTGTRGVGKTSIARLMAKSLNCEQGVSAEPCLQCEACVAVEQGRFMDLIEVDAASKTRVEDTRDMLDNVPYAPTRGRYKIYLIDEVHMLSQHSFNALLKTLEEPPDHVKFLLATTDPQKLPVTILSRCLQFNLKHISTETIAAQLQHITDEEKQPCEAQALALLAKAAQGSMRDALSLLDQVIACAGDLLTEQQVKTILGYTRQDYALPILRALIAHDPSELIRLSRNIAEEGGHFDYVINSLLESLHQITLCQNLPEEHPLLEYSAELKALAGQFSQEDTQLFYQIALKGREDMHLAPALAAGFEMTLLRMLAFKPVAPIEPPLASIPRKKKTETPASQSDAGSPVNSTAQTKPEAPREKPDASYIQSDENPAVSAREQSEPPVASQISVRNGTEWETLLPALKLSGLAQTAAENAEFISKHDRIITLRVDKGHQSLFTPAIVQRIEQSLAEYYGETIRINLNADKPAQSTPAQKKQQKQHLRQEMAETNLQNDPFLQQLQQEFSAELVKNSIAPAEDPL